MKNNVVPKLIANGLLGMATLLVVNIAGAFLNYHLAINIVSIYVAGFLGIPGVVLLAILKKII